MEELSKKYDIEAIEKKWQKLWEENNVFVFNPNSDKEVYSIDTPPPFTSGTLHMGHVYNHVWIDIIARYKRMRGYEVYFPQGFDCHGLPTELRVESEFGVGKEDREEFLSRCAQWTKRAIAKMKTQFKSIGYSSDWTCEYYTMSNDYKRVVQKSLLEFYGKRLLYREKHPVLWCPRCGTALAKAEVGYVERKGRLYYLNLDVDGKKEKITIATTRPELMSACVAVMVHPEDKRYKHLVGSTAKVPLFGLKVPVIEDPAVDMEFGTGAVYVCTFGDEQDIQWQKKYGLRIIESIDKEGKLTDVAGEFAGMDVEEAREVISKKLIDMGHVTKVGDITHSVLAHTERGSCNTPIEFIPLKQWFINIRDFKGDILKSGESMKWHPQYMFGRMKDWIDSMDWDWIISRQRVFGTPIPFFVCDKCDYVEPAREDEFPVDLRGKTKECPKCKGTMYGEQDVCDCWIDSSLTPLWISRWGRDEKFFNRMYPVSLRPQGYEIIRTWTFYTIFRSFILTDKPCFKDIVINGMIAGPDGKKMSKSLGNIIAPEEPLKKYGADVLRQWAAVGTLGDDYPFTWEECDHSQRFLIKMWNISRFISMHLKDFKDSKEEDIELSVTDKWILSKVHDLVESVTEKLDGYVFNAPTDAIRSFVWHDFADNYLELVKHRLYKPEIYGDMSRTAAQYTLKKVMSSLLKLMYPITPHVAEEIWHCMIKDSFIATESWPASEEIQFDREAEKTGEFLVEVIGEIRKYKTGRNISLGAEIDEITIGIPEGRMPDIENIRDCIMGAGRIKNIKIEASDKIEIKTA